MAEPTIQLGGGNWAGKTDNLLGYYKEGERFYKQDFTFSRSTTGTYTDKDGYIQEMPYNEVTYSEQFDLWAISGSITRTSNIATAPNGTLTADGIQDTSGGSYKRVRKSISVNPNSTYTSSCYIKKVTSETAYTGFGLVFSGGTQKLAYGIIDSVNGTITSASSTITPTFNVVSVGDYWRFEMTATDNGSNSSLEFSIYATISTNGTSLNVGIGSIRTLWGAQLNKGTSAKTYFPTTTRLNMPRVDYLNNSNGSLILEPQRTNLITQSESFESYWIKTNITASDNEIISPDGTQNACLLTDNSTDGYHNINRIDITPTDSNNYTRSFYVKKGTARYVVISARQISSSSSTSWIYDFDDNDWSVTASSGEGQTIEVLSNGWIRLSVTIISSSNFNNDVSIGISSGSTMADTSYIGSGDTLYIWGGQIEQGSYATTLINTSGSSVTRNADACTDGGDASRYNDSEGVLFFEGSTLVESGITRVISLSDGSTSNNIYFNFNQNSNSFNCEVLSGGSSQFNPSVTMTKVNNNKIALKYKANDFALWINGTEVATDTSGSVPSGLDRLNFDFGQGSFDFEGNVKQLQVYNTALSDSELATLTT